jgi:dUTPase
MKYVKIKEIKSVKSEPVYHLTVEKNHNFFGNKLCLHNCDYRGEVKVILINHGTDDFIITNGDRIAQAVVASVLGKNIIKLSQVDSISNDTVRGSGGLGSTGTK